MLNTEPLNLDYKPEALILNPNHKLLNPNKLSLRIVLVTWSLQPIVFKWKQNSPSTGFASWSRIDTTRDSRLWNFSVRVQSWSDKIESDPVLISKFLKIISPIQSWSAIVKSCIFIWPHEAKKLLKLFCLLPITIGWRQNTSSSAFTSWGKIDTAFRHLQNLTRENLLGIRGKSTAGVILPLGEFNRWDWSNDKDDTLG